VQQAGSGAVVARPSGGACGVVVEGLDLAADVAGPTWQALRQLLVEHRLVVVRGQSFDDARHVEICAHFGRIAPEGLVEKRSPTFVSNLRPDGVLGGEGASFHIDYGFFPEPYELISLYGLDIPAGGTETIFVDAVLAARTLPAALRARVQGCSARQVLGPYAPGANAGVRVRLGRLDDAEISAARPVLWPHRTTGEEILGVWEQQTDAILPLRAGESTALIEELFAHLYRPEHRYVHEWAPGDLVIWDNHALQHGRAEVGTAELRTLRRVCVGATQDLSYFLRAKSAPPSMSSPATLPD
jgi:alpha-ketoglutarate-dependent taurine dioxygenase